MADLTDRQVRLRALQIAARGKNYGTADIVNRAAAFTKFIIGTGTDESRSK